MSLGFNDSKMFRYDVYIVILMTVSVVKILVCRSLIITTFQSCESMISYQLST